DRDALQLVNDHVTVLYPRKGVSDLTRFTPAEVETKYGLTPTHLVSRMRERSIDDGDDGAVV
ncbi:hypothetical protein, partial [Modestobacter versicolor]